MKTRKGNCGGLNARDWREMKKARQGVVGLARASDIHYKREKKVDACAYSRLFTLRALLPTAHKYNLLTVGDQLVR